MIPQAPPVIDLIDPGPFERNDFWDALAWLRANSPVYRHPGDPAPFWVLTRHRDIAAVYGDSTHFGSRFGMRIGSDAAAVAAVAQRMLIVSDPPQHTAVKRTLMEWFGPSRMPRVDGLVRQVVDELITEDILDRPLDFIEVAKRLPNHVVCALMDLPRADWDWIGAVTTEAFDDTSGKHANGEIFLYFADLLAARRAQPGDDFVSWVATQGRVDADGGRPLTDEEIIFNCNGVLSGANETTRYVTAGGLLAFAQFPEQWERLRALGAAGVAAAVEEALRWTSPGVHAMRTVLRPTEIAGQRLRPGERITLWNASANRDEEVFDEPDRFLVDRSPNRHLAFGHGRHLCLGARMARCELNALFGRLAERVASVELTGTPSFTPSNFTWGVSALPLRLHGRA
ncbi:cytochrome P450 [Streptomyces sp. NPDC048415]|uniref:cytochrome P450 n=1 Tax=Streptomyces sp. NPDC048415 TaxID=3154822 RepID=UPI00341FD6A9